MFIGKILQNISLLLIFYSGLIKSFQSANCTLEHTYIKKITFKFKFSLQ